MTKSIEKKNDILFLVLLFCVIALYLTKLKYGFPTFDESLYLALPWRFVNGDHMFINELIGMQMSSWLLIPLLKVYLYFFNSTEGIILVFRYVFLVFQFLICVFSYLLIRKTVRYANIICCAFFLYVPFGMMALSYNTMPLSFLFLLCSIVLSGRLDNSFLCIVLGVLLSFVVLCQPATVVLYLLWIIIVLRYIVLKKRGKIEEIPLLFSKKTFALATVGVMSVACLFLFYVFSECSINNILYFINSLQNDTAHLGEIPIWKKLLFIDTTVYLKKIHVFSYLFIVIFSFIFAYIFKDSKVAFVFLSLGSLLFVAYEGFALYDEVGMASVMFPLTPLGLFSWIYLSNNKRNELINVFYVWFTSIIYMYFNHITSNTAVYNICNGCAIASLFSIVFISNYLEENFDNLRIRISAFVLVIITVQLLSESAAFYNNIFKDKTRIHLTTQIEAGPAKGIYTTSERAINYKYTLLDIDEMLDISSKYQDDIVLYIDMDMLIYGGPIYYLYANEKVSPPFAYSGRELFEGDVLNSYYLTHPEKSPNVIFLPDEIMTKKKTRVSMDTIEFFAKNNNMSLFECSSSGVFLVSND